MTTKSVQSISFEGMRINVLTVGVGGVIAIDVFEQKADQYGRNIVTRYQYSYSQNGKVYQCPGSYCGGKVTITE